MDKTKQSGATTRESRELEIETLQRDDELRNLTDVELRLAGGGEDGILW